MVGVTEKDKQNFIAKTGLKGRLASTGKCLKGRVVNESADPGNVTNDEYFNVQLLSHFSNIYLLNMRKLAERA